MSSSITDPEVLAFIQRTAEFYPPDAVNLSIVEQRNVYDDMAEAFRQPRPTAIATENGGFDGPASIVPIRRYWPSDPGPVRVLYYHGGGFVVGGLESHNDVCAELSLGANVEVISVDYRLCPEHPHPAAYEDALAAVDAFADRPLIVVGDSAGGNLAAAVALARPHKLWGQVLIYPGLGGNALGLASYSERAEAPMLTMADLEFYAQVRAGGPPPMDDPTFAPLAAKSFADLPPCFISAAEHDPLRDDGEAYVMRLTEAHVAAEFVVEPELPHGHLRARTMSSRADAAFQRCIQAVRRMAEQR
ncbi:MAG: alpha/beta hydrolase [Pseudomonadota bacterium]